MLRAACIAGGCALLVLAPLASPLPGPGGMLLAAAGLTLILPNSPWAMRRFARLKHRWPWGERLIDRVMRRPSASRRAEAARLRAPEAD